MQLYNNNLHSAEDGNKVFMTFSCPSSFLYKYDYKVQYTDMNVCIHTYIHAMYTAMTLYENCQLLFGTYIRICILGFLIFIEHVTLEWLVVYNYWTGLILKLKFSMLQIRAMQ